MEYEFDSEKNKKTINSKLKELSMYISPSVLEFMYDVSALWTKTADKVSFH